MTAWPFQPYFNPSDNHIYNAGSNYILRPDLFKSNIRPFVFLGMQIMGGISYFSNTYIKKAISIGVGMAMTDPLEKKGRFVTGIFYDLNNSLMSSLIINGTSDLKYRLNIYPGILKYNNISPGILFAQHRNRSYLLGFNLIIPLGIGIGP